MSPSPFFRVGGGGYYLSSYGDDHYGRGKTPAYFSRSYWDTLSETTRPFVKIEELDSSTDSVISRKNYAYTPTSLALYSGGLGYSGLSTYVSPSSLIYPTTLSDYYPYYRLGSSLWNADPLTYSRALLSLPSRYYSPYYPSSLYSYPYYRSLRTYYPSVTDSAHYINRLLPYYYHPRPVYHTTYSPTYHYHYDPPRTTVTRTSRSYYVPPAITYHYTPSTYAYAYSSSSNYLL